MSQEALLSSATTITAAEKPLNIDGAAIVGGQMLGESYGAVITRRFSSLR